MRRLPLTVFLGFLVVMLLTSAAPPPQEITPPIENPAVLAILNEMSPEERVGQLFLVTFNGSGVNPNSDIGRLIREYHVGGVVLSAENDNFDAEGSLAEHILALTNDLQMVSLVEATPALPDAEAETPTPVPVSGGETYVPLFIGIEQTGGYQRQLLSAVTPLPSNMALGATWTPGKADLVGEVQGRELDALGINMLLGPTLDVLESPQTAIGSETGVSVFGGDRYWVSQMGAAYVTGAHRGSNGRLVIIPRNFPGVGSADRPVDEEIPTVPRTLSQLILVDLPPFFAVTAPSGDPMRQADGLMTGHIRFLGFQGDNPLLPTRPISLDPQALQELMSQGQVATWRAEGGMLVSGSLGDESIRRFYGVSPDGILPHRRVAQDAFLAGNDLLYLDKFGPALGDDQTDNVIDTIDFFVQRYNEDPTFQARVDAAAARIIYQKLQQYEFFEPARIQKTEGGLNVLGQGQEVLFDVAQSSLTLLAPSQGELLAPPQATDRLVIFTDARRVAQCSTCEAQPVISVNALSNAIISLYGPGASGQVRPNNVQSYSFQQLSDLLQFGLPVTNEGDPTPEINSMQTAIDQADWIIFVMLDVNDEFPSSSTVKDFLAQRAGTGNNANIVVMAMDAPYYLDATEISKLSAYYGIYGTSDAFVNIAARALYQEALPLGASPVSVASLNYELRTVLSPDPAQVIELYAGGAGQSNPTPEPGTAPAPVEFARGDDLAIRTGVIVDHNGNPVPDGTPVDFNITFVEDNLGTVQRGTTVNGVAEISLRLDRDITVTVTSEPALLSFILTISVGDSGAIVDVEAPDVTPTQTNSPPSGPGVTPEAVATDEPEEVPTQGPRPVSAGDLMLTMLGLTVIGAIAFRYGQMRDGQINTGLSLALGVVVAGFLIYDYYAVVLSASGESNLLLPFITNAALGAWVGGILGFAVALGLVWWLERRHNS